MGLGRLVILFAMAFVINVFSMKVSEMPKMAARIRIMQKQKQRDREKKYETGKYFIYERNTSNGILVNAEEVKQLSSTINNIVIDSGHEPKEIMLPFPADIIKLGFDVLNNKENNSSLTQLVNVGNLFSYLEVSDNDKWNNFLGRIKKRIENQSDIKSINESFVDLKQLNPNIQKLLMTIPIINFLRTFIISRISNYTRLYEGHTVTSVAFNSDGKYNAVGHSESSILLSADESGSVSLNRHLLAPYGTIPFVLSVAFDSTDKFLVAVGNPAPNGHNVYVIDVRSGHIAENYKAHKGVIKSVAFLPSGAIVLGCDGKKDNFKIVDTLTGATKLSFDTSSPVNSVVCAADGKLIISGHDGNDKNLILWDISNVDWDHPQNTAVIQKNISDTSFNNVTCLALSKDNNKFVSGSKDGSLILWNIKKNEEFYDVSKKLLTKYNVSVNSVAFSHDNKNILVGLSGNRSNVALWDISDENNAGNTFTGLYNDVYAVKFSPNDEHFFIGGKHSYFNPMNSTLIDWRNITDKQKLLLNNLKKYEVDQLRLIYKLCLISLKGHKKLKLDSEEQAVFITLQKDMQKLLYELSFVKK
jgi:WD40 repeat protein